MGIGALGKTLQPVRYPGGSTAQTLNHAERLEYGNVLLELGSEMFLGPCRPSWSQPGPLKPPRHRAVEPVNGRRWRRQALPREQHKVCGGAAFPGTPRSFPIQREVKVQHRVKRRGAGLRCGKRERDVDPHFHMVPSGKEWWACVPRFVDPRLPLRCRPPSFLIGEWHLGALHHPRSLILHSCARPCARL